MMRGWKSEPETRTWEATPSGRVVKVRAQFFDDKAVLATLYVDQNGSWWWSGGLTGYQTLQIGTPNLTLRQAQELVARLAGEIAEEHARVAALLTQPW